MNERSSARIRLIFSMIVFGTVGIFVKYIPLPSGVIAAGRGLTGALFLLCIMALTGKLPKRGEIKGKLRPLILSGVMIASNWIFLFESYRYTTVATATLCYYLQPVFVTLAAPVLFREKLTAKKVVCVFAALLGIALISWNEMGKGSLTGVALGVAAAVLYAGVVLLNKGVGSVPAYPRTFVQLLSAGVIMVPYSLFCEDIEAGAISARAVILLIILGIFHTGFSYAVYFGSVSVLPVQTVAVLGFIDPVVAIVLSAIIFHENPGITGVIGALLILGAAFVSEYSFGDKKNDGA